MYSNTRATKKYLIRQKNCDLSPLVPIIEYIILQISTCIPILEQLRSICSVRSQMLYHSLSYLLSILYYNTRATKTYLISKKPGALSPIVPLIEYIYITDKYVYSNTSATKTGFFISKKFNALSPLIFIIEYVCITDKYVYFNTRETKTFFDK